MALKWTEKRTALGTSAFDAEFAESGHAFVWQEYERGCYTWWWCAVGEKYRPGYRYAEGTSETLEKAKQDAEKHIALWQ